MNISRAKISPHGIFNEILEAKLGWKQYFTFLYYLCQFCEFDISEVSHFRRVIGIYTTLQIDS